MANVIGEFVAKIGADMGGFNKGIGDADKQMGTFASKFQKHSKTIGIGMTAIGAAGLKLVDSAREMNAQLGATGITVGKTTDEMRAMALEVTNVTFSLKSVISTFDLLSKAGVKSAEGMKASANAFDALADATNSSAEIVAGLLLPAYKVFGKEIPKTANEMDKFTWLVKNTLVDLSDFGTLLTRMSPYMDQLNMSMEDAIAVLAALGEKGIVGTAATLKLRTAITQAASGAIDLNTALGLTQDEIDGYKTKMSEATGITEKYADQLNTQYGIMDKLKQKWSEISFSLGSVLTPLEPVLAGMTALGPAMLLVGTNSKIASAIFSQMGLKIGGLAAGIGLLTYGIIALHDVQTKNKNLLELYNQVMAETAKARQGEANNLDEVGQKYIDLARTVGNLTDEQSKYLDELQAYIDAGRQAQETANGLNAKMETTYGTLQDLTNQIYIENTAAGKANLTLKDVINSMIMQGTWTQEAADKIAGLGDNFSNANMVMALFGLTADKVTSIITGQTEALTKAKSAADAVTDAYMRQWMANQKIAGETATQAPVVSASGSVQQALNAYAALRAKGTAVEEWQVSQAFQALTSMYVPPDMRAAVTAVTGMKFHSGGIVPGRPGQEVPIMAEAGEVVTPADAGRGGITIIQNVAGSVISERELGRIAQRELLRLGRLNYSTGIS